MIYINVAFVPWYVNHCKLSCFWRFCNAACIVIAMQINVVVALRIVHCLTFFLPDNCVSDFVALLCSTERILFTSFSVPRVLIAHARSLQTFTAVLDWLTHLVAISCWYRSDARQDESQKMLYCKFQKYEVMTMSVVEGQPKSHENATNKATRHVERTFTRLVC